MSSNSNLVVEEISFGGSDFAKWVSLRTEVLRAPLGLSLSEEDLAVEVDDVHLVARSTLDGTIVGGLILTEKNCARGQIKMRQVAVDPAQQRQGIGAVLLAQAEVVAIRQGAAAIVANVRETALGFYQAYGYALVDGQRFIEVTIPHFRMMKVLSTSPD